MKGDLLPYGCLFDQLRNVAKWVERNRMDVCSFSSEYVR